MVKKANKKRGWKPQDNLPGPGPGRPKGSKSATSAAAAQMILDTLEDLGGIKWLREQAVKKPAIFASLMARILPREVNMNATVSFESQLSALEGLAAESAEDLVN